MSWWKGVRSERTVFFAGTVKIPSRWYKMKSGTEASPRQPDENRPQQILGKYKVWSYQPLSHVAAENVQNPNTSMQAGWKSEKILTTEIPLQPSSLGYIKKAWLILELRGSIDPLLRWVDVHPGGNQPEVESPRGSGPGDLQSSSPVSQSPGRTHQAGLGRSSAE